MKNNNHKAYQILWKKYLPAITLKLRQTIKSGEAAHIGMYQLEFHSHANNKTIGQQFNFEVKNGRLTNNATKSEAGEELSHVMRHDVGIYKILLTGRFQFSLDHNFMLTILKMMPPNTNGLMTGN